MSKKINIEPPFGEAIVSILDTLTDGYKNESAWISFSTTRKGDIRDIDVHICCDATQKQILTKGHAHCTWTKQFYPTAVCMDINTLFEELEKGVTPTPKRTFEDIVLALAENPLFVDFACDIQPGDINRSSAHFEHKKSKQMFTILSCGHFWTETQFVDLSPDQLAAISSSCSKIADNYAAEHANDNRHE